jgi:hypothetical protein
MATALQHIMLECRHRACGLNVGITQVSASYETIELIIIRGNLKFSTEGINNELVSLLSCRINIFISGPSDGNQRKNLTS